MIDIGANFGAFSIAASQMVGDSGRVFCYEPNPFVFERLQENLRMNGCRNVTAFNEAVGGRDGDIELFIGRKSAFSTTLAEVDGRQSSRSHSTKVPLRRIESVLRLAGPCVALLKVDCEGGDTTSWKASRRRPARQSARSQWKCTASLGDRSIPSRQCSAGSVSTFG